MISSFFYLGFVLVSHVAMVLIDRRWKLFWWASPRRAALVHGVLVATLLLTDIAGIAFGIFFRGHGTRFMTGILLGHELPLEELFFLAFLVHLCMNIALGVRRLTALEEGSR